MWITPRLGTPCHLECLTLQRKSGESPGGQHAKNIVRGSSGGKRCRNCPVRWHGAGCSTKTRRRRWRRAGISAGGGMRSGGGVRSGARSFSGSPAARSYSGSRPRGYVNRGGDGRHARHFRGGRVYGYAPFVYGGYAYGGGLAPTTTSAPWRPAARTGGIGTTTASATETDAVGGTTADRVVPPLCRVERCTGVLVGPNCQRVPKCSRNTLEAACSWVMPRAVSSW